MFEFRIFVTEDENSVIREIKDRFTAVAILAPNSSKTSLINQGNDDQSMSFQVFLIISLLTLQCRWSWMLALHDGVRIFVLLLSLTPMCALVGFTKVKKDFKRFVLRL